MKSSLSNLRGMCAWIFPGPPAVRVGSFLPQSWAWESFQRPRGLSTAHALFTESKETGKNGGGKGTIDPDGYSLEMDSKSQEKLSELKGLLEKNSYYEKYKSKIVESQR